MKIAYTNTGEIQGVFSDSVISAHASQNLLFVSDVDDITGIYNGDYYVDLTVNPPAITPRPTMPTVVNKTSIVANGADTAIFSNIPNNTVCTYDNEDHVVTDGLIEFTATHDGEYNFTFTLFPYIPKTITITASEAETAK